MPANPQKGEVEFTALGKEWILRFDTNAICILEEEQDRGISEIAQLLQSAPRVSMIRAVFRAAVVGGISLSDTNDVLDEIGAGKAVELWGQAFDNSLLLREREPGARPTPLKRVSTGRAS